MEGGLFKLKVKKTIILIGLITLISTLYLFNFASQNSSKSIVVINNFSDFYKVTPSKQKTILVKENINYSSDVKDLIKNLLDNDTSIFLEKTNFTQKDALDFLEIGGKGEVYFTNTDKNLTPIGVLISPSVNNSYDVTQVNIDNLNDKERINDTINQVIQGMLANDSQKPKLGFYIPKVFAENIVWKAVNSKTFVDSRTYATISTSLTLQKNPKNPDGMGNYYSIMKANLEITPRKDKKKISRPIVDLQTVLSANGSGSIIEYSPQNSQNTKTVSISFPPGISTQMNLGTTMTVNKVGGGIGSSFVHLDFYPTKIGGIKDVTNKKITAQAAVEMSQSKYSSRVNKPSFYEAKLVYYLTMGDVWISKLQYHYNNTILISGY